MFQKFNSLNTCLLINEYLIFTNLLINVTILKECNHHKKQL